MRTVWALMVMLEQAVGQRRLPVVDVGDDREVADVLVRGSHRVGAF
jgi:hypothetical protein